MHACGGEGLIIPETSPLQHFDGFGDFEGIVGAKWMAGCFGDTKKAAPVIQVAESGYSFCKYYLFPKKAGSLLHLMLSRYKVSGHKSCS